MTESSWTEERVARAKELYLEGVSAGEIARDLGGTTRNAVIGKINRLGWRMQRGDKILRKISTVKAPRIPRRQGGMPEGQRLPHLWKPKPFCEEPLPEESCVDGLVPLAEFFTNEGCAWITGEPTYDAATCGRPRLTDSSYCCAHHSLVWVKPRERNISLPRFR
jgi:GcrA cell cycle regulator